MDSTQPKPGAAAEAQFETPVDELAPVLDAIKRNFKPLAIGIGSILLIVAAYGGFNAWQKSRHNAAVAEVGKILVTTEGADRVQALETYLSEAPDDMRPALTFELARAAFDAGDFDRAAQAWKQLGDSGVARLAPVAVLGQAQTLAAQDKYDEALGVIDAGISAAPEGYTGAYLLHQATYAEKVGDWAKAAAAYQGIRSSTEVDREFYDFKIAQFKAKLEQKAAPSQTEAKDTNG